MKPKLNTEFQVQSLFLQHASLLKGFIFGMLGDRAAAEDVFQETFLTVSQRAGDFDSQRDFLPWARGIARNKMMEYWRRQGTSPQLIPADMFEGMSQMTESLDVSRWEERRAALAHCLELLAPRARQILELRYAEQHNTPTTIAKQLDWSINAVNVALSRARQFLQDCTERTLRMEGNT